LFLIDKHVVKNFVIIRFGHFLEVWAGWCASASAATLLLSDMFYQKITATWIRKEEDGEAFRFPSIFHLVDSQR